MNLVIHEGVQFDADNLPAGIDPKKCVPIDEWYATNRVAAVATGPVKAVAADPKPAARSGRSKA